MAPFPKDDATLSPVIERQTHECRPTAARRDLVPEDSYGRRKRLVFVLDAIAETRARRILDVGCGTGVALTRPVAEAFPTIDVTGADTDPASIEWATSQRELPNLAFTHPDSLPENVVFDVVILSEVLEHVDEPLDFLRWVRRRVTGDGIVVLTVPNGLGPFELMMFVAASLHGRAIKRRLSRFRRRGADAADHGTQTLAVSPHVNFFRRSDLASLFAAAGFEVEGFQPTTFLCGPGLDGAVRALDAAEWNARIVDRLPAWCASDWMFALRPVRQDDKRRWRRGAIAQFRRRMNLKRWGVK
jgi:2-polyprenyl-3-methyl-5-hydroxy-6-metoxy-1,4-benzoquinol methylase